MNALIQNFKKDFRRFLLPLALWVVSFAILTFVHFLPSPNFSPHISPETSRAMTISLFPLTIIYLIMTVVLAAGVILEDPPKGTTAFWLTRPLSRKSIAAEKLCFLAAIILFPVLVELAFMVSAGAGPHVLALAALDKTLTRTPLVLAVAAFAITAETFGQCVINAILILIGSGLVLGVSTSLFPHRPVQMSYPGRAEVGSMLSASRHMAFLILVSLLGGGIVIWRYSRRHARFTMAAVAVASLISMLTASYWSWNFLAPK